MTDERLTPRLRLVPLGPEHADDLWLLHQDPGVIRWYGEWDRARIKARIAEIQHGWRTNGVDKWIAHDRTTGTFVGRGALSRTTIGGRDVIEVGWIVRESLWGNGYATEIGRAGLDHAFGELGADEVVAFTEVGNERSISVMRRLGMRFVHEFPHDDDGVMCVLYEIGRDARG